MSNIRSTSRRYGSVPSDGTGGAVEPEVTGGCSEPECGGSVELDADVSELEDGGVELDGGVSEPDDGGGEAGTRRFLRIGIPIQEVPEAVPPRAADRMKR